MRKIILVLLFWAFWTPALWAGDWTIIKGASSTVMDSLAASELKKYVEKITGRFVPVIDDTQIPATTDIFLVGKAQTNSKIRDLAQARLIQINAALIGPEGFINKTVDIDGKHYVVLSGLGELGVQYAVYDFLESYCKVGFLLDGDTIPHMASLKVDNLDVSKRPFCAFRQQSVYGKGKLWYGFGTCFSLATIEQDGYKTGWKDFIDWMIKKKQNVLYLKRGSFNIGYIVGFSELNNPADIASIDAETIWFNSNFAAESAKKIIAYARSRGMKTCFTATICRVPKCFKKYIEDPKHPCYGLKYEDKGSWLRLDPLDDRSYTYCLRKHVDGIIKEFGCPDFWYGYYGWSEQAPSMGLPFRSYCHYKAYELVFRHTGGSLLVYTWDWGRFDGYSLDREWLSFKKVMPKNGRVILILNNGVIPDLFLNDPQGPFAGFPWWRYITATKDDQCLPETFGYTHLISSYESWKKILQTCSSNYPCGFGIDNMIHHVDQRLTDFECVQSFCGNAGRISLDDFLADYTRRAYGKGSSFDNLFSAQRLWTKQEKLTIAQIEQYMIPEWLSMKDNIIYRTDLTEALFYEASDYDKCALMYGKWIYSKEFTKQWAKVNIPAQAWVVSQRHLWESVLNYPTQMTYENKAALLGEIKPGILTVSVADGQGKALPKQEIEIARGYLTKIAAQESFKILTDDDGRAQALLKPDVYEIRIPGLGAEKAVLMLHNRDKFVNFTAGDTEAKSGKRDL